MPLKVIGCFEARVVLGDKVCGAEFVVIEGKGQPLLAREKYSNQAWSASDRKSHKLCKQ